MNLVWMEVKLIFFRNEKNIILSQFRKSKTIILGMKWDFRNSWQKKFLIDFFFVCNMEQSNQKNYHFNFSIFFQKWFLTVKFARWKLFLTVDLFQQITEFFIYFFANLLSIDLLIIDFLNELIPLEILKII